MRTWFNVAVGPTGATFGDRKSIASFPALATNAVVMRFRAADVSHFCKSLRQTSRALMARKR